jgi:hypothetical protein
MAVAKKKPNKQIAKPMPVGKPKPLPTEYLRGPNTKYVALGKMMGAPSAPQARNLTPPNATGIKKVKSKKNQQY